MPIEALPQATVRAIGSTSVISDPCSVVKELIDNALDASASSVSVEISQNTVDVIQLKDNGHGISVEDHPCVCKHTFTSKISSIDDLKNIGGTSLGFRGEALASVAEMSGGVSVTTRVASDIVASALEYGRDGELTKSRTISHPTGTTVRIRDFLKYIPVRRQAALKGATKCLSKIKSLIQAYAMAQPSKRFSLKVLKAKNENNNWTFAPGSDLALADAAAKVAGRDVTSLCTTKEATSTVNLTDDDGWDQTEYRVIALLPRADTDLTKINNKGQFLSIDGRPLSTSRGVGHEIVKLFKSHLRAASLKNETPKSVSDPFLCLQLKCPLGSYDVNIEPGKDDMLFEDRELVFNVIEKLFADHYGALPDATTKSPTKKVATSNFAQENAGFDLLMARRAVRASQIPSVEEPGALDIPVLASSSSQRPSHSPAAPSQQQTPGNGIGTRGLDRNSISEGGSSRQINPWSISRVNSSFQDTHRRETPSPKVETSSGTTQQGARQEHTPQRPTSTSPPQSSELPSPVLSRLTPAPPVNHRRQPPTPQEPLLRPTSSISASRRAARERDRERYGNGAVDTWFQRTTQASLGPPDTSVEPEEVIPSISQLVEQPFKPLSSAPTVSPLLDNNIRSLLTRSPRGQTPDPSSQPIHGITSPDNEHQSRSMDSGRGFPVLENWAASIHEGFTPKSSSELEKALDFERRKREANQRHRTRSGQLITGTKASTSNTPHRNRYLAAKAALNAGSAADDPNTATVLPQGDPRAYLISLQTDRLSGDQLDDSGTIRRTRTSRLPLERIPEGHGLHNIRLPVKTCSSDILESFHITALHDTYTRCGDEHESLLRSDMATLIPSWNEKLSTIISTNYKTIENSQAPDLCINISTAVEDLAKRFRATESQSA